MFGQEYLKEILEFDTPEGAHQAYVDFMRQSGHIDFVPQISVRV